MGNRWSKIIQENVGTFASHTPYAAPVLEFDFVDLDGGLEMNNEIPFTSAYSQARYHFLKQLDGKLRVNNYAAADNIGEFLKSVLGTYSVAPGGTGYKHTFKPDDPGTAWTVYDYDSDFINYRQFLGCQATKLEIAAQARDAATFSWESMYADEAQAALGATTMGTLPAIRPFMFYDGAVTIEAAQAKAENFRCTVDIDIPADTHTVGARARSYLVKQTTSFTVEVDLQQSDWVNLARYYGGSASTSPEDTDELIAGDFKLTGGVLTGGTGDCVNYALDIVLPAMIITGHKAGRTRRDRKMETVTLKSIYNAGNLISLVNTKATYVAS